MLRYRIYAMKATPENIEAAQKKYKYFRATKSYLLVYTEKRKPQGSVLVKDAEQLADADKGWIQGCNIIILDELARNNPDTQNQMMGFLSDLERELERERELLKEA